jgi:hypothetical protein
VLGGSGFLQRTIRLDRLVKNSVARGGQPSAAEARTENRTFIAAVNRCATQNQEPN